MRGPHNANTRLVGHFRRPDEQHGQGEWPFQHGREQRGPLEQIRAQASVSSTIRPVSRTKR